VGDISEEKPRTVEVIVSAVILNKADQILIVRQPKWGDLWTLPGGHLLPGERLAAGARREGGEETGLNLNLVGLVSWGELFQRRADGRPVHFIYFDYLFRADSEELDLDARELSEARWVKPEEALRYELTPGYRKTIEILARKGIERIETEALDGSHSHSEHD
jgi:ADP-ribose pyrophosphatase YjhB (NUDIX family)